jgi:hypothetical protein
MAYLKSAPYPVPGLGLHGLPVDSLHSSMAGYPGGNYCFEHQFNTLLQVPKLLQQLMRAHNIFTTITSGKIK